jgi:hypothetical protein
MKSKFVGEQRNMLDIFEGTTLELAWIKMRGLLRKILTRPRMELDVSRKQT